MYSIADTVDEAVLRVIFVAMEAVYRSAHIQQNVHFKMNVEKVCVLYVLVIHVAIDSFGFRTKRQHMFVLFKLIHKDTSTSREKQE